MPKKTKPKRRPKKPDTLFELFGGDLPKIEKARQSYNLPVELIDAVRKQSDKFGVSQSEIVEKCLRKVLKGETE